MAGEDGFGDRFGQVVGRGAQAVVYARDETAVKVFQAGYPKRFAFYEAAMMALVEATDLPVPAIHEVFTVEGRLALRMSRVRGRSLNQMMADDQGQIPTLLARLVDLQRRTHAQRILLPVRLRHKLGQLIQHSAALDAGRKAKLLTRLEGLPEGDDLCHGDFHGDNILCHEGQCTIIDWTDVSTGCALGDACRTYLDYSFGEEALADLYLDTYCAATGADREAVLRWLPVQAASMLDFMSEAFRPRLMACIDGA